MLGAILVSCLLLSCDAFVVPSLGRSLVTPSFGKVGVLHMARPKKKRRRKKSVPTGDDAGSESLEVESSDSGSESFVADGELPDFDFDDGEGDGSSPKRSNPSPASMSTNLNENAVTGAMMGSSKPMKSMKELLNDRSLESKFEFEEVEDPLPDLADFRAGKPKVNANTNRGGNRGAPEEDGPNEILMSLRNIPVIGDPIDEKGEISAVKLLETGAWLGIFLLVGWEIYINSPLFDRAAPMIPAVYESEPLIK
eukprot:CAMPEP_0195293292 /NCGR_PEP_ID=MMETSP0707-20130614/12102_1 /TAXON_ID=33640 /ORGANISM="Asterionellopsis glacialis, Strain CCMP134" /LENGTH=252 /DNA_ID=CAMNT_0040353969 /DNA_START=80 /DNA_END=838 /DNA_ORIENTATION=-